MGNSRGRSYPVGNCPVGSCPRGELSWWGIVGVGVIRWGIVQWGVVLIHSAHACAKHCLMILIHVYVRCQPRSLPGWASHERRTGRGLKRTRYPGHLHLQRRIRRMKKYCK